MKSGKKKSKNEARKFVLAALSGATGTLLAEVVVAIIKSIIK